MFHHQATLRAVLRRRVRSARRDRRGVILLVVLAMLALFTMIGLTLVLSTSQARLSALSSTRGQRAGTPPAQQLSRAFHEIARGSENKFSTIQAHNLMEDLYGMPLFIGRLSANASQVGNGELIQFPYTVLSAPPTNAVPYVLPNANFVYTGLVITMTSGNAANRSSRIVRDVISPSPMLTVTNFDDALLGQGDTFVINGRPFSGTGFGFQLTSFMPLGNPIYSGTITRMLDAMDPTPVPFAGGVLNSTTGPQFLWPYALLPNHAKFASQNPNALLINGGGNYVDPGGPGVDRLTGIPASPLAPPGAGALAGPGGANEPYDAPDFQNMHLAVHYFDTNFNQTL
ncbi:MAG TPA: hypothetical protein VHC19_22000, partial [Pirellulales bacterium]|nr:hypothetical protein [Pirellulales bacterium]